MGGRNIHEAPKGHDHDGLPGVFDRELRRDEGLFH
jgi:hypothetical protein